MHQNNVQNESIPQYFKRVVAHLKDGSYCLLGSHSDISAKDLLEEELWDELDESKHKTEDIEKIEFASPDMPRIFYHVETLAWSLGDVYASEPQKSSADVLLEQLMKRLENK